MKRRERGTAKNQSFGRGILTRVGEKTEGRRAGRKKPRERNPLALTPTTEVSHVEMDKGHHWRQTSTRKGREKKKRGGLPFLGIKNKGRTIFRTAIIVNKERKRNIFPINKYIKKETKVKKNQVQQCETPGKENGHRAP